MSTGVRFFAKSDTHSASSLKAFLNGTPAFFAAITSAVSKTTTAISVFSAARWVFSTLRTPSSLSSSKPAVSMITQGPRGCISIGLYTGSVVVPATSATIDTSCFVIALISEDFPLFVFPYMPICNLLLDGVSFKFPIFMPPYSCKSLLLFGTFTVVICKIAS